MKEREEKKILVVDDEVEICELIQSHVEEMTNYKVFPTHNVKEALSILRQENVDVVISDVRMPGGDGMGLLDTIKALPPPRPHVIIMSGLSPEEEEEKELSNNLMEHITHEITRDEVEEKGGHSYFSKPLDYQELVKSLKNILKNR